MVNEHDGWWAWWLMRSIVNEHDGWWAWWSMSLMVDEHNGQGYYGQYEQIWEAEGFGYLTDWQTDKQTDNCNSRDTFEIETSWKSLKVAPEAWLCGWCCLVMLHMKVWMCVVLRWCYVWWCVWDCVWWCVWCYVFLVRWNDWFCVVLGFWWWTNEWTNKQTD